MLTHAECHRDRDQDGVRSEEDLDLGLVRARFGGWFDGSDEPMQL